MVAASVSGPCSKRQLRPMTCASTYPDHATERIVHRDDGMVGLCRVRDYCGTSARVNGLGKSAGAVGKTGPRGHGLVRLRVAS
jgi:hypothetical protein